MARAANGPQRLPDLRLRGVNDGLPRMMWWHYCEADSHSLYRAYDATHNVLVYLGWRPRMEVDPSATTFTAAFAGHDATWRATHRQVKGYPHVRETLFEHRDPKFPEQDRVMVHVIAAATTSRDLEALIAGLARVELDDAPFR